MAERIRLNPVGGNFAVPKMPAPMAPVHMASRIPGATGMHNYLGHFATPTNLRAGHNTNWIAGTGVNKPGHKGRLHRALGVPEGQKIPRSKIEAASHSKNSHLRHMAQFAKNV